MLASLGGNLKGLVNAKFNAARSTQDLILSSTELAIVETGAGVPFQLRFCPALARKPPKKDAVQESHHKGKKPDPFDNPDEALLITQIPKEDPSHILVLNKYPVIPDHFILATKQNKQQTALLEQDDLEASYSCLKSWDESSNGSESKRLFAFFNSGDHSGASQPHRHVQFLPEEQMANGQGSGRWRMLIDLIEEQGSSQDLCETDLVSHPDLPFLHFGRRLDPNLSTSELFSVYHSLYHAAESAVRVYIEDDPGSLELHATEDGANPISYNLAMTTSFMAICPRRKEGGVLHRSDGSEIGFVALNGTVLAGTLMVKGEEEWETLKTNKAKFDKVLRAIGIPATAIGSKVSTNKL